MPLALIIGPALTVLALHRYGIGVSAPGISIAVVQLALGTSVGLMFKGVAFAKTYDIPPLLVGLIVCLIAQFTSSYYWFHKRAGWTKKESILGAVPGAMSAVLAITHDIQVPPQKIIISHSIRLLMLVSIAGLLVGTWHSTDTSSVPPAYSPTGVAWLVGIVIIGYAAGRLLERFNVVAPYMLTSLLAAIAGQVICTTPIVFPGELNQLAMILLGVLIGTNLTSLTLTDLYRTALSSTQVIVINLLIASSVVYLASRWTHVDPKLLLLSWVPGSVETMTFAAMATHADMSFVMSNHIVRMLIIQTVPAIMIGIGKARTLRSSA